MQKYKSIAIGAIGAVGLFGLYLLVLTLAESFSHALAQLAEMWYWIALLVSGFGIQLGLYFFIRMNLRKKSGGSTAEVVATGGISTGAMIACCAHHLTEVLPLLGLSAAALFLAKYQLPFIHLGIFSNLVGIVMMLSFLQKHGLQPVGGAWRKLLSYNLVKIRTLTLILAVGVVAASFLTVSIQVNAQNKQDLAVDLGPLVDNQNAVSVEVVPIDFSIDAPIKFRIGINTHQGDLKFDLTRISQLSDHRGNLLEPLSWEGSPPGGHHRSGILTFPPLSGQTEWIRLTIKDVYNVPERIFEWKLL